MQGHLIFYEKKVKCGCIFRKTTREKRAGRVAGIDQKKVAKCSPSGLPMVTRWHVQKKCPKEKGQISACKTTISFGQSAEHPWRQFILLFYTKQHKNTEGFANSNKKHYLCGVKRFLKFIVLVIVVAVGGFFLLSPLHVLMLKWGPVEHTPLMTLRKIEAKQAGKSYEERKQWVYLDAISPEMVRAVIASEDNLFVKHNGFSETGIRRALDEYKQKGRVRHGGSTISQQTAKNVFTSGRRNYVRKGFETWYTFLIERIWGKRRIMEVYLNVLEAGDGIYGVEAASQAFFRHPAKRLSRSESALIAVCLPNPRKMHPDRPSAYVRKRQEHIVNLMPKLGKIELEKLSD